MENKSSVQIIHEWLSLMDQASKILDSLIAECEKRGNKMTKKEVEEETEKLCGIAA